jgi:hypothetical protein
MAPRRQDGQAELLTALSTDYWGPNRDNGVRSEVKKHTLDIALLSDRVSDMDAAEKVREERRDSMEKMALEMRKSRNAMIAVIIAAIITSVSSVAVAMISRQPVRTASTTEQGGNN